MMSTNRRQALAKASMEATRLLRDLSVDTKLPVDVFSMAQDLGLWLMAQPLDKLYGSYLRVGDAVGIMVNSNHPESLQRFTIAHEIGHHVLGHEHVVDDTQDLNPRTGAALEEAEAQTFAASLLMPLPLMNRILRQFPRNKPLGAVEVYLFSRQVGVSYTAAIWTLQNQRKLSPQLARSLAKKGAAAAKSELRGRKWTNDARADVWVLGAENSGLSVVCRVGDEIHLHLPENLSTGHVWLIDEPAGSENLFSEDAPTLNWSGDALELAVRHEKPASSISASGNYTVADAALSLETDLHIAYDGKVLGLGNANEEPYRETLFELEDDQAEQGEPDSELSPLSVDPTKPGTRLFVFVPYGEGASRIRASLRPPPYAAQDSVEQYELQLRARARQQVEGRGLIQPIKVAWLRQQVAS